MHTMFCDGLSGVPNGVDEIHISALFALRLKRFATVSYHPNTHTQHMDYGESDSESCREVDEDFLRIGDCRNKSRSVLWVEVVLWMGFKMYWAKSFNLLTNTN